MSVPDEWWLFFILIQLIVLYFVEAKVSHWVQLAWWGLNFAIWVVDDGSGGLFFKDFTLYFFGCFRFEQLVGKFYFLSSWHMLLLHCIVLFLMALKVKQLLWASVLLLVAMLFRLQFLPCSCLSSLVSGDLVLWLLYKFYHYNLCCRLCFFKWY